jgi:uncharacterized protein YxeA
MKKYLIGLMAVVLAIGFSAFNGSQEKKKSDMQQTFTWHKYNPAGTSELSPVVTFVGTANDAKSAFNCPDGLSVICARAYDEEGTPLDVYVRKTAQ